MQTLNTFIAVKKLTEEIKTSSGLLVSDSDISQMRYTRAEVVMDNADYDKVKKGDIIYYDKVQGQPFVTSEGEHCIIIHTSFIVMVE